MNPEARLESVRALSEGRAPKKFLRPVPIGWREPVTFAVPVLPPLPPVSAPSVERRRGTPVVKRRNTRLASLIQNFVSLTPGEFTVQQCHAFCFAAGYSALEGARAVSAGLRRSENVDVVRREKSTLVYQRLNPGEK